MAEAVEAGIIALMYADDLLGIAYTADDLQTVSLTLACS